MVVITRKEILAVDEGVDSGVCLSLSGLLQQNTPDEVFYKQQKEVYFSQFWKLEVCD